MKFADLEEKARKRFPVFHNIKGTFIHTAKKVGKRKRIIAAVVVIAIVGGLFGYNAVKNKAAASKVDQEYTTMEVTRQDISQELTGSGTLEAANAYSVTSLVEGEVLGAHFEEGDVVEKDSVLYELDASDMAKNLEKAQISKSQSQRNYDNAVTDQDDLTITTNETGTVYSIDVEVGDDVSVGQQLATIKDCSVMELMVSFPSDDIETFYVGEAATVTLDGSFETLSAKISKIAGVDTILAGNRIVRSVTLQVTNPGAISNSQTATATVNGVGSSNSGTFTYRAETTITAKVAGTVSKLYVKEGDVVRNGKTIMQLTSDTIDEKIQSAADSLRNAELSYESTSEQLDSYCITSPISGTIIDKNYEVGETTEANQVLCTIYDLTYLTLTLNVDELDISEVKVGQNVDITADAVEGKTFEGTVTKVSVAGTTSSGVTSYPVTIRIDESDGLLPGMNVDASILISESEDTVVIPAAALQRGNRVLVTKDSPSSVDTTDQADAPEGYVFVTVSIGVSNDDSVEILSGLLEGDTVAYVQATASSNVEEMPMGMMGGGMPGGGMPGGGVPGGGTTGRSGRNDGGGPSGGSFS